MHHSFVIAVIVLSHVCIHKVHLEILEYDPFRSERCETQKRDGASCFSCLRSSSVKAQGPKQKQVWKHYFLSETLTASVGEYLSLKKDDVDHTIFNFDKRDECRRITVFSVGGVTLDGNNLLNNCRAVNDFEQVMLIDNLIWYYPTMRIRIESGGENVVAVTKKNVNEAGKGFTEFCEKKYYSLHDSSFHEKPEKTETVELGKATDEDCKALLKGETGPFPANSVNADSYNTVAWTVNAKSDSNFGLKVVKFDKPFCHFKVVVLYQGSPITGTGMFCGHLGDMFMTDQGVYFGRNIVARLSPSDPKEMTVLVDPRNGQCIKHRFKLGSGKWNQQTIDIMHEPDQECNDFKEEKLTEQQANKVWLASVTEYLQADSVDVVPYYIDELKKGPQPLVKAYDINAPNVHSVNVGRDMGVLALPSSGKSYFYVILVAKGVVLDIAILTRAPNLTFDKSTFFCEDVLLFKRDQKDENLFTVLTRWDYNFCSRSRYVLVSKDGRLQRQEIFPAEIGVFDHECKKLIARGVKDGTNNYRQHKESMNVLAQSEVEMDLAEYTK